MVKRNWEVNKLSGAWHMVNTPTRNVIFSLSFADYSFMVSLVFLHTVSKN